VQAVLPEQGVPAEPDALQARAGLPEQDVPQAQAVARAQWALLPGPAQQAVAPELHARVEPEHSDGSPLRDDSAAPAPAGWAGPWEQTQQDDQAELLQAPGGHSPDSPPPE